MLTLRKTPISVKIIVLEQNIVFESILCGFNVISHLFNHIQRSLMSVTPDFVVQ